MADYKKPLPTPTYNTKPFWEAAKQHKLIIQRCRNCGTRVFYPRDVCPGRDCLGIGTLEWMECTGKGFVYSFTISMQPQHPAFNDDVPYVFGIVELDEGVRMTTNIINIPPQELKVGQRVEVVFDDVTDEFTLVKFQPVSE